MYPVTVIIPHYDEPRPRLDASVASCLAAEAAEVVVVDDGSETPPTEVSGARLVHQTHRGIAAALNAGLEVATQEWIAVIGCGDLLVKDRFERQFQANSKAVFSDLIDPRDATARSVESHWRQAIWRDNQFSWSTVLCHRSLLDSIGGWNEDLRYAVDWEISIIIHCMHGWTYVPGPAAIGFEMPGGHTATGGEPRHRDLVRIRKWANEQHLRQPC